MYYNHPTLVTRRSARPSHVYYNIASFVFKGVQLEQAMGPRDYAILLGSLLILSHGLVVLAAYLATFVGYHGWYHSCAIGFR